MVKAIYEIDDMKTRFWVFDTHKQISGCHPRRLQMPNDWKGIPKEEYVSKLAESNLNGWLDRSPYALVMFYAPWCGHCKAMKIEFAEAAAKIVKTYNTLSPLACINGDDNPRLLERFEIKGYPTLIFFRNGKPVGEYNAGRKAEKIVDFMVHPPL